MHVMIMEICCLYLCNDDNNVSRDLCATAMVYIWSPSSWVNAFN